MAQADWTELANSLSSASLARGVTSGAVPPNGGGVFVYGFNSRNANAGAAGLFTNQLNFAPMAKGGTVRGAVQRGLSGGPLNFSPLLFIGLQGGDVSDLGYLLGLSDDDPHHVVLVKGSFAAGIPAGDPGSLGILRKSTAAFTPGTWQHLRMDMVYNTNGDVLLQVFRNDLTANPVTAPVWVAIPGMATFVDDALGVNSGTLPFTSGRAGFGFTTKDVSRRGYFDHLEVARQL